MKKYELTSETKNYFGKTLYRIKALRDFADVKKGDLGGWIQSEKNLSHDGDCWVSGNARVCGNARVFGNARVYGDARVSGKVKIYDNVQVYGSVSICEKDFLSIRENVKINSKFKSSIIDDKYNYCVTVLGEFL